MANAKLCDRCRCVLTGSDQFRKITWSQNNLTLNNHDPGGVDFHFVPREICMLCYDTFDRYWKNEKTTISKQGDTKMIETTVKKVHSGWLACYTVVAFSLLRQGYFYRQVRYPRLF